MTKAHLIESICLECPMSLPGDGSSAVCLHPSAPDARLDVEAEPPDWCPLRVEPLWIELSIKLHKPKAG